uniref:Uncharacterized protein n=1 Tax=Anguilla anguilla TaxID=7936 RepID=A0A0E9X2M7_ANGAN
MVCRTCALGYVWQECVYQYKRVIMYCYTYIYTNTYANANRQVPHLCHLSREMYLFSFIL